MSRSAYSRFSTALAFALALSGAAALFGAASRVRVAPGASSENARPAGPPDGRAAEHVKDAYGRIALSFEANRGQTDASVDFLARGAGYALFLKSDEAVFALSRRGGDADEGSAVLRMRLVGAETVAAEGAQQLEGRANYFVGDDPSRWRADVPTYGRVQYRGVYPGIDLVYYGNQRQLEYDFVVAPGADANAVGLRFEGTDRVELDGAGDLVLSLGGGEVRQPKPYLYQEVAGARREVEGGYAVGADGRVGFRVGDYDPQLPLVIDPVITYSTYLGGSDFEDGSDIKVDSAGNAYVCGFTESTNFPVANAFQGTFGGAADDLVAHDAFITKLNAAGTAFVYSTYLGGNRDDRCNKIAVDAAGNAYLAGETTSSTNFPRANALQNTFGGGLSDAFVTKINAAGSALVYSTYLGGSVFDAAGGIALDSSNNVYITGRTTSDNFPTANAIQSTQAGIFADAFVTKINAAGSALVYSTYLGGSNGTEGGFDAGFSIAVDSAGNAYVTGQTRSTNFPTANSIQATFGGGFPDGDAFVTKINAAGSALVYSTYLGGTENDIGFEIAVDSAGSAHVSGVARSANFPTANAMRATFSGPSDAFVAKLNPAGTAFAYSTYLGGSGDDSANGIALDSNGNVYLALGTSSTDIPTVNPTQGTSGGGIDAFIMKLNPAGSSVLFSTYLGGGGTDAGLSIAVDSAFSMYIVGRTASTNFPVLTPVQAMYGGGTQDAFMTKISDPPPAASTFQFSQAAYPVNEDITFVTLTVTRSGDTSTAATVDYATADGTASERSDYTTALGTLRFAAGEQSKTFVVLVNEDSKVEGSESFAVTLSNATGGPALGTQSTATVQIADDAAEPATNVIDDPVIFVGTHYHDFFGRQHDQPGLDFWSNQIIECGANAGCIDNRRQNVSGAFFLSIEFQETGYLVYRTHKAAFGNLPGVTWPLTMRSLLYDMGQVGAGVIVGQGNWQAQLEANKQAYFASLVQRPGFVSAYPPSMTAQEFVDKLNQNAGNPLDAAERANLVNGLTSGQLTRAQVVRAVAEDQTLHDAEYRKAFVYMQYVGYLRRDPDQPGFDFWLQKLNNHNGDYISSEMIRSFIVSGEYRGRFGN